MQTRFYEGGLVVLCVSCEITGLIHQYDTVPDKVVPISRTYRQRSTTETMS